MDDQMATKRLSAFSSPLTYNFELETIRLLPPNFNDDNWLSQTELKISTSLNVSSDELHITELKSDMEVISQKYSMPPLLLRYSQEGKDFRVFGEQHPLWSLRSAIAACFSKNLCTLEEKVKTRLGVFVEGMTTCAISLLPRVSPQDNMQLIKMVRDRFSYLPHDVEELWRRSISSIDWSRLLTEAFENWCRDTTFSITNSEDFSKIWMMDGEVLNSFATLLKGRFDAAVLTVQNSSKRLAARHLQAIFAVSRVPLNNFQLDLGYIYQLIIQPPHR